ncbi:hypothetical protein Btru_058462 [Bulinus truncatus]|nr:hypothetical protein Btru_058462 [Bulinus truncatus]
MNVSRCIALANSEINVSSTVSLILCLVTSTICAFSVISNVTIFIALVRSVYTCNGRQMRNDNSNTVTKLTLTSYVAVEILVAILLMPMTILEIVNKGRWTLGSYMCRANMILKNVTCFLSIVHIVIMAVDRYLAVCHPLVYMMLTSRHGLILVALSWACPTIIIALTQTTASSKSCYEVSQVCFDLYESTEFVINLSLTFFFPFLSVVILYVLILIQVRRFHQRTSKYKGNSNSEQSMKGLKQNICAIYYVVTASSYNVSKIDADETNKQTKFITLHLESFVSLRVQLEQILGVVNNLITKGESWIQGNDEIGTFSEVNQLLEFEMASCLKQLCVIAGEKGDDFQISQHLVQDLQEKQSPSVKLRDTCAISDHQISDKDSK